MTEQAIRECHATLRPRPPYDFDLTCRYATYGGGRYGADVFEAGAYTRLLDVRGHLVLATARSAGTVDAPVVDVIVRGDNADQAVVDEAALIFERMLGAGDDVEPFYRMADGDSVLAPIVSRLRGLHVPQSASAYEALVLAILGQQISTHVARMLRTLLIDTLGPSSSIDGETYRAFPRPQDIDRAGVEALRLINFSSRKAEYVVGIASRVASGRLDLESMRSRSDQEVVAALTGLRGVGPWTANWLLIRAFGRPDGFPAGDLALQRTLGRLVKNGGGGGGGERRTGERRRGEGRSADDGVAGTGVLGKVGALPKLGNDILVRRRPQRPAGFRLGPGLRWRLNRRESQTGHATEVTFYGETCLPVRCFSQIGRNGPEACPRAIRLASASQTWGTGITVRGRRSSMGAITRAESDLTALLPRR